MGMMIGRVSTNKKVIQIKNLDGSIAGTISISKPGQKKLKRLQYNFKAISAQILLSKTSNSASKAVTKARGTIALLLRKVKTGEYDDQELEQAIIHAKKMERIAKKRMKHLKQEEDVMQKGTSEEQEDGLIEKVEEQGEEQAIVISEEELQRLLEEYKELMQESMKTLTEEAGLDELSEELTEVTQDMDEEDLEQLKKKHRSDELREIADADMKYLRALFQRLEKEKQAVTSGQSVPSGVSLEISGFDMPVDMPDLPAVAEGGSIDLTV